MAHEAARLDEGAVEAWLAAELPGFRGPLVVEKYPSGQSNPTFLLKAASGEYVLRRQPPGKLLKSAHAVDREYRVMSALQDTDVPVPRMLALCEDREVIGSMFFVMERVEGRIWFDPRATDLGNDDRALVYDEMNRILAALHSVDIEAVGLSDFGKPGGYFARQVRRWTGQYRDSATEEIPEMDRLIEWLEANTPEDDGRVALVHGDYRIDNMIFREDLSVAAVLDWELSTLGHPFADLGYQCMQGRLPQGEEGRGLQGVDRAALGIPSEDEYVARYCRRMGIDGVPILFFCIAFSFFRIAAILQGVKKRGLDGNASNPERAAKMGAMVPVMARMALEMIETEA